MLSSRLVAHVVAVALFVVTAGAVRSAHAAGPLTSCVLKGPLVITSKPKGQGRKIHLTSGTSVEIVGRTREWLQLRGAGMEGYGAIKDVRHTCVARGHNTNNPDALVELPLEALPLPALAALPDDAAKPAAATAKPAEPVVAAVAAPAAPQAAVEAPTPAPVAAPVVVAQAAPTPPTASVQSAFAPTAETPVHLDDAVTLSEQPPAPRHLAPLRIALWSAAGVTLAAAGGIYIYNTVQAAKLRTDILAYNKLSGAQDPAATTTAGNALVARKAAVRSLELGNWAVAGVGAALAITAGVLTFVGDSPDADSTSDASTGPHHLAFSVGPGSFALSGKF